MKLNSPGCRDDREYWENNRILTGTFDLNPVEKPDMSPFLIHMTGKQQILSILKGEGNDDTQEEAQGFLKSYIPKNRSGYQAKVVCFTESPTFALDFFRRRSKERWEKDQKFGLGFSKSSLVQSGVRPVIYLDQPMIKDISRIYFQLEKREAENTLDQASQKLLNLVRNFYPLVFPLLESTPLQGFMWEREWRAVSETGFVFKHSDLRIICCPEEEQGAIEAILQGNRDHIQFVRSWQEYNDVTDFLNRQSKIWEERSNSKTTVSQAKEDISEEIQELLNEYQSVLKTLEKRKEFIDSLQQEREFIENKILQISQSIVDCQRQIEEENLRKRDRPQPTSGILQNTQDFHGWDDIPF